MKNKKFIKTLAMAVLLSGSLAVSSVPVYAVENETAVTTTGETATQKDVAEENTEDQENADQEKTDQKNEDEENADQKNEEQKNEDQENADQDKDVEKDSEENKDKETDQETDKETDQETDKETEKETDKEAEKETDQETDQETDKKDIEIKKVVINETNFPDANFREYVKSAIDKDQDGILSKDEIISTKVITCRESRIKSLKGVEFFPYLEELQCLDNKLTTLDVSKNIYLKFLACNYNEITSLDLSQNTDLEFLLCGPNKLTSLDVSKNVKLRELNCAGNQLTKLDVSKNVNLTDLYVFDNQLKSLNVSKNVNLIFLDASKNAISEIDITKCTNLMKAVREGVKTENDSVVEFNLSNEESEERPYIVIVDKSNGLITNSFFKDVIANEWYNDAVLYVKEKGIMNGTDKMIFSPSMTLNRAQFVTVLHNMEGGEEVPVEEYVDKFIDVPQNEWYTNPVMWALKNGITSGVSEKEFGSEQKITREQLATLLYKYADMVGTYGTDFDKKALDSFPDKTEISDWAQDAMSWAVSKGVISGKASDKGNLLDPKGQATRAECAQMIMNFITKNAKTGMAD